MANVHELITDEIGKLKSELEIKLSDFDPEKLATSFDAIEDNLKTHINNVLDSFKVHMENLIDEKIAALKPETAGVGAAGDHEATLVDNTTAQFPSGTHEATFAETEKNL
jgi:hypothetical protein